MIKSAFTLTMPPEQTTSTVFASPHSGRYYPAAFLARSVLDKKAIRSSEDAFMDDLIAGAVECGAPFLAANWPRAYLDLNRGADELDPALIAGLKSSAHNPRISSGLGVIPRVVSNGRAIYSGKLDLAEAKARIAQVWTPYHTALEQVMEATRAEFGEAVLVDCHSMPHEAVDNVSQPGRPRPDVVLGDRFGASADSDLVDQIETIFLQAGLRVSRNAPFAGAYIAQHYGRPSRRMHAVQIEIDRALYLDEATVQPNAEFANVQRLMQGIVAQIADLGRRALPLAAE